MTIFRTWKKNVTLNGIRTWNLSFTILCSKLEVPGSNPTMGKKKIHVRKIANFSYCVLLCLVTGKAHLWTMKDKHCGELMNNFWCFILLPSTNSWTKNLLICASRFSKQLSIRLFHGFSNFKKAQNSQKMLSDLKSTAQAEDLSER